MDKTSGIEMSAVGPGPPSYSVAMELDPPAYSTITQQPGVLGSNFGPPGVTVRTLTDTPQDAEFAARLMVVAFKPKLTHAVGERKECDTVPCEMGCCAVCGLVCFGLAMNESVKHGKCYLEVIAVEDGFRGRGMDKALMDRAEQEARARHCKSIYLAVVSTNRAKNLYEREGYVVTSEETCCCCLRCTVGEKNISYKHSKSQHCLKTFDAVVRRCVSDHPDNMLVCRGRC